MFASKGESSTLAGIINISGFDIRSEDWPADEDDFNADDED
jgi:hypothetical protein